MTRNDILGRPRYQDYVLLSVGDQSYHEGGKRLEFDGIMQFLYDQFVDDTRAIFAGFHLNYDFTHWLRDLPEDRATALFNPQLRQRNRSGGNPRPFPVRHDDWELDILPGRLFRLRPHSAYGVSKPWMTVCDAGPFFQGQSFLSVVNNIRKARPDVCTDEEYAVIMEGKSARTDAEFDPSMVRYNLAENRVFSRVLETLDEGLRAEPLNIKLSKERFYSPGSAVQTWLTNTNQQTTQDLRSVINDDVLTLARNSYYGGWFETFVLGHVPGKLYEYDICSAYPHIIRSLPCLCEGVRETASSWLCLVDVETQEREHGHGGPLTRTRSGSLRRVNHSRQVMWEHEYLLWVEAGFIDPEKTVIHSEYRFEPVCNHAPPLACFKDFYQMRRDVGKDTPVGIALKLVMNSGYGKFAQSVGNPKYANPIWASLITSGTRCLILSAIASHPHGYRDLVMVATDGVYFRTPHPELELGTALGQWECAVKENAFVFKPGVYWDKKARANWDEAKGAKSRGIPLSTFHEWARDIERWGNTLADKFYDLPPGKTYDDCRDMTAWNGVPFQVRRPFKVLGARLALARHRWEEASNIEVNVPFIARPAFGQKQSLDGWLDRGAIHYRVSQHDTCVQSYPYAKNMGLLKAPDPVDDITTEKYDTVTMFREALVNV